MIQAIVFDLDGTIVDSLGLTFDSFNHTFRKFGHRELSPAEIMSHFGPGEKQIFRQVLGEDVYEAASETYHAYVRDRMGETPLFSGMREALDGLVARGFPLAVLTGRGRKSTDFILAHHQLKDFFQVVITHDEAPAPKPSPAGILHALRELQILPSAAAYVGDMWSDVRAARAAGCHAVAAMWDRVFDAELMRPELPHISLKTPAEIVPYFSR